ncbi:Cytochrome c4 [hydrothermal vent metagenome]|uniref:Cytochrome c4 n=1 Tax=hydrothermal vent metagenome TaxID=652676 RepID=A0A3B0XKJ1_9ZZZZ
MNFKSLITICGLAFGLNTTVSAVDLAAGEATAGAICAGCHMPDGNSVVDMFPKLAGQHAQYLAKQLNDYKSGARTDATMNGMAATLATADDVANVAAFFASKKSTTATADTSKVALGQAIFRGGNTTSGLPACMGCHSPDGSGNPAAKFPALAGQHTAYTIKQLNSFRDGSRSNDSNNMMREVANKMTAAEIEAVANYIAQMK